MFGVLVHSQPPHTVSPDRFWFHCYNKILDKSNLVENRLILAHRSKSTTVHHGGEGVAVGANVAPHGMSSGDRKWDQAPSDPLPPASLHLPNFYSTFTWRPSAQTQEPMEDISHSNPSVHFVGFLRRRQRLGGMHGPALAAAKWGAEVHSLQISVRPGPSSNALGRGRHSQPSWCPT